MAIPEKSQGTGSRTAEVRGRMMNDLRDIYSDPDTMFVVSVISDAMRRGVRHFKLDGTPLGRLNEIIDALAEDGEILMDADGSKDCPRH
ncbi:MAG TPA: hypothetical protein VLF14_12585 [Candidatus Binatia bacterium]|nr:hypothetical protein [Candidatus Binatia bacterium]